MACLRSLTDDDDEFALRKTLADVRSWEIALDERIRTGGE